MNTRTQIGYAGADIGMNAVEMALRLYLLKFYTDFVGLQAGYAGIALAIGLLWDAVTDPLMGAISDRTAHGRFGRRIYLLIGGAFLAVAVVLLFHVPEFAGQGARFAWLVGTFCFLNTALTVINVPHMAMAGEMTADPHERSVLFGWRFICLNVGAVFATVLPLVLLRDPSDQTVSVMDSSSLVFGGLVAATALWTWWATRGVRFLVTPPLERSFLTEVREAFANPTFRPLVAAYFVATIGIGINAAVALYYYSYRLDLSDRQIQVLVAVFMGVFTLSILGWVKLAKRFGKNRPLVWGAGILGAAISLLYPFLPAGNFVLPLVIGAIGLGSLVGCIVLIDSILTDVIDHNCVFSGARRSGVYFGVWRFASKVARAVSIGVTALTLELTAFVPNEAQTEEVRTALGLLFGPGVGVFFLVAAWLIGRYRFDDAKQRQVARILLRRAETEG